MKIISRTVTFGSSSHYLKSSASVTFEGDSDEDLAEAVAECRKAYITLLKKEVRMTKKMDDMDWDEIYQYACHLQEKLSVNKEPTAEK